MIAPGLLLVSSAGAQTPAKPFSVALGLDYLEGGSLGSATARDGWIADVGYHFAAAHGSVNKIFDTSVDFTWSQHNGHGGFASSYGLFLEDRTPFTSSGGSGIVPYYGVGLGVVRDMGRVIINTGGSDARVFAASASKYTNGEKILLGLKFGSSFYLEGAYNFNGGFTDASADSVSVSVGVRF